MGDGATISRIRGNTASPTLAAKVPGAPFTMIDFPDEKECSACGDVLPIDEFHRKTSSPDGRQERCIRCDKLRDKKKEEPAAPLAPYKYEGVRGGMLLAGYIR